MHLTWTDAAGNTVGEAVPAHIIPYVEAIGLEKTIAFFLAFGGTPVYLTAAAGADSQLLTVLNRDEAARLVERFHVGPHRVPIPAKFIARALKAGGSGTYDIARQLRRTHTTINAYLRASPTKELAA